MKIVVIGGTGLIGSKVVAKLTEHGHEAIAASPSSGVNSVTGEGVAEVLAGAGAVIDVSNAPSFDGAVVLDFFTTSTTNLLKAAKDAGVGHYVALSVVGTQRLNTIPYFDGKVAQEKLIVESGLPYSIVHATQFFEFATTVAETGTVGNEVHLTHALIQPIASDDVAAAVARAAVGEPVNGIREIAGPEVFGIDDFARTALTIKGDPRTVVTDPGFAYFGGAINERDLIPGDDAVFGETRFEEWVRATVAP